MSAAIALDRTALEALLEIADGDETFVDELLQTYLDQARLILPALQAAWRDGDENALRRHAHTLKGASLNVGANGAARVCRKIEEEAGQGPIGFSDVAALQTEVEDVRAAVSARHP